MSAAPAVSLEALTAAARNENRHAARKIAACYDVHRTWIVRDTAHKHYSRYGRTEMANALGCSATVAEGYGRGVRLRRSRPPHPTPSAESRIRDRRDRPRPSTHRQPNSRQPLRRHRRACRKRSRRGRAPHFTRAPRERHLGRPAPGRTRGSSSAAGIREEVPDRHLQPRRRTRPHPSRTHRPRSRRRMAAARGDGRHDLPQRPPRQERTLV